MFVAIGFAGFCARRTRSSPIPVAWAKPLIIVIEVALLLSIAATLGLLVAGPPRTVAAAMSEITLFGLGGAALVGLGLYGFVVQPEPLRKLLAFNLLSSGVFLLFGVIARRGAAAGMGGDPIPQALVITGIVVAFAGSALAVGLLLRLCQESGRATLSTDAPPRGRWCAA